MHFAYYLSQSRKTYFKIGKNMKKMILASILFSSVSYAQSFEVKCEAAVGPRLGRNTTEVAIEYKDGTAFIYQDVNGYVFNGSCNKSSCEISISNKENINGFVAANGAFSKQNHNSFNISYFSNKDTVAEIECQRTK